MVGFEKEGRALSARGRSFAICWWRPDDGTLRAGLIVSRLWGWASGRGGRKVERRYPRTGIVLLDTGRPSIQSSRLLSCTHMRVERTDSPAYRHHVQTATPSQLPPFFQHHSPYSRSCPVGVGIWRCGWHGGQIFKALCLDPRPRSNRLPVGARVEGRV